jgi:hypothetical protein
MARTLAVAAIFAALVVPALAHHGWGSYDAAHPVTITGPITASKFENPHATVVVKTADKAWTVTLAPTFRMNNRGVSADMVAVGRTVTAFGYPSTVDRDEMRAERITLEGKTFELR